MVEYDIFRDGGFHRREPYFLSALRSRRLCFSAGLNLAEFLLTKNTSQCEGDEKCEKLFSPVYS
jgi:hypothetical protein